FIEGDYKFTIERKKFETKSINFTIENDDIKTYDLSLNDYQLQKYLGGPGNGVLSMLLPGLGTYYVTKKSSSFITTSAFILSVLAAIYTQNQSNQIRDKYLAAQDPGNIANLYRAAQEQHTISLVFSGIATTIYLVDVIHAFSKGTKNKRRKVIAP
ncbi:MAG: hypothetical protein ORN85_06725, partial [Sediminibacterium sp.]|nr:hypothetical protein [Sediminibacterium sp.]